MKNKSLGFALMEVIISIVLLGFFLAGAASLIWSAINASQRNRDRITATYLTQECLELARNARDTAWKQYLPWDCAFKDECNQIGFLRPFLGSLENFERVKLGPDENPSKFTRTLESELSSDEIKITCSTFWQIKKNERGEEISMSQVLTNWKKK